MHRIRIVVRAFAIAVAVAQAAAPAVFAMAEVNAARESASHVEDQTRRTCVPVHPDDCTICRAMTLAGEPARAALPDASAAGSAGEPASRVDLPLPGLDASTCHSRAPPHGA